jgi:hypothetical protein
MIENGLWESLTRGVGTEICVETERLHDRKVCLDSEKRGSWTLLLVEDVTTSSGKNTVNTTHGVFWYLNLDQEDWLKETWLGQKSGSVENTTSSWDKLTTTSVDGIGVEGDIHNVESARSHWLFCDWTFS